MSWRKRTTLLLFALHLSILVSTVSWGQQPQQSTVGNIDFQILDSATGYAVGSATIKWDAIGQSIPSVLSHSGTASSGGQFQQQLSPGEYVFEISAPGYQTTRTHFDVESGSVIRPNINLDPVSPPPELRENVVASELRDGLDLVHGYVVDKLTHSPMANVQVTLSQSGAGATTNARGYFQIYVGAVSTADLSRPEDFPALDTLTAAATGHKSYILSGLLHVPGSALVTRIEMTPGTGTTREQIDHPALMTPGSLPDVPPPAHTPIGLSLH
jgi:hypothetical protein